MSFLATLTSLAWIPRPTHPGASCETRERNFAIAAIASCFVFALICVILGIVFGTPSDPSDAAGTLGAGYGTGSGDGFGAGVGGGSSLTGNGPGAGVAGERSGATGDTGDNAPRGQRTGTLATSNAREGESLVAGESKEIPKYGFTMPGVNDPIDPPATATAVGKPKGNDGAGKAGSGGGGGTQFMGVRTQARDIIFIVDFSSSMRNEDGRAQLLKQELTKSIQELPANCRFTVIAFGASEKSGAQLLERKAGDNVWTNAVPMPPVGGWVPADASHKAAAISWIVSRDPDPQSGSGTWDSMRMALKLKPEAIFLLTDGEFFDGDLTDLRKEIAAGNSEGLTQINTVAFACKDDIQSLQTIAAENQGTYRRVSIPAP